MIVLKDLQHCNAGQNRVSRAKQNTSLMQKRPSTCLKIYIQETMHKSQSIIIYFLRGVCANRFRVLHVDEIIPVQRCIRITMQKKKLFFRDLHRYFYAGRYLPYNTTAVFISRSKLRSPLRVHW